MSRSPSPAPSNLTETNSLKDSPVNFDSVSTNSTSGVSTVKCVLAGGSYRGWVPDSAIILWRRMLGVLGDINSLSDPSIHVQAMECLIKITEDLIKVRENIGVGEGKSLASPFYVPPLHYITPWLLKATYLSKEYKLGKILAYKLLCLLTVGHNDVELSKEYLALFYRSLHTGLTSYDVVSYM